MGVVGAQAPVFIQNLYATQNNVTLTPQLQQLLTNAIPAEVIDVTPYEDTSRVSNEQSDTQDNA